jgi:hypothetical protein
MSINVTDIVTMHGQVYKDSGQGVADIHKRFHQKSVTENVFGLVPTTETIKHRAFAMQSRVLQLFQKENTEIGSLVLTPQKAELTALKVDVAEWPDDIVDTWAGFLGSLDANERMKWPFVKWWLEEHVLPEADENWELLEIYHGTKDTVTTPGTANAAGENFVGIKKQINTAIGLGTTTPHLTGAFSDDAKTFVEQIELWLRTIKESSNENRTVFESGMIKEICLSPSRRDLFKEGMGIKYNTNYNQISLNANVNVDDTVKIHNSNITIKGLPSMIGSDKIWATPTKNKWGFVKRPKSSQYFQVSQDGTNVRKVKASMDFWKGVGFWLPQYVYTNDLEL